jgi:ABC-type Mn2+/Zn2+ transport system ATPase subunit
MAEPVITLQDVSVELGGQLALENDSCQIEEGCLAAVMGPNGAGKTTLLHAILGLLPFKGRIRFGGIESMKRPRIGYLSRKVDLDRVFSPHISGFIQQHGPEAPSEKFSDVLTD